MIHLALSIAAFIFLASIAMAILRGVCYVLEELSDNRDSAKRKKQDDIEHEKRLEKTDPEKYQILLTKKKKERKEKLQEVLGFTFCISMAIGIWILFHYLK